MKKLNIGCGGNWRVYPDYEGLDIVDFGQKYIMDIFNYFLEWREDNAYEEVMANHFLEHFDQNELKMLFGGIFTILKVGGIFRFVVPHKDKDRSWVLPHKTFWNETTVRWLEEKEANEVYGFGKWKVEEVVTNERKDIHALLKKL